VPGLYFIGTLMQSRDFKKTMSGFIHGFRHNIEAFDQMLACKYQGAAWRRSQTLALDARVLAETVMQRVSTAPGMFLQPGFLCDVITLSEDETIVTYYEDVPVDYAHEQHHGRSGHYYLVTLEYGQHEGYHDPFAMPRGLGVQEDFYLHPIIRRYKGASAAEKFVLPDDLDNDWRQDEHFQALHAYFEEHCAPCAVLASAGSA